MKIGKGLWLPLIFAVLLFSCASGPEETPPEEPVEETPVEEPAEEPAEVDTAAVQAARDAANDARGDAESVRAPKAAPDEFNAAVTNYDAAVVSEESGDLAEAIEGYQDAETGFAASAASARRKRTEAEAAMKAADEAIANTERNAEEAIKEAEGDQ